MPAMAYCKKCKQEVEPGDLCPLCGQKLTAGHLRISWTFEYMPARDFLSWNAVLRVGLPALILLLITITVVEWAKKGWLGVQILITQGFLVLALILAAVLFMATLVMLQLRGHEELRYIIDSKGVHVQVWQKKASLLKRLFRVFPKDAQSGPDGLTWMLEEKHIPFAKLKRVNMWSDKDIILLYAPKFWLYLAVHCLPDTYDDAVRYLYDHVKKQQGVMQPPPDLMTGVNTQM